MVVMVLTLTIGGDISSYTQFGGVSNIEVIAPAGAHDITANGALGDATTFSLANGGQNLLTLSAGWTADTTVLLQVMLLIMTLSLIALMLVLQLKVMRMTLIPIQQLLVVLVLMSF